MPNEVKRSSRVSERVREELSWLLTRDVRDPRVAGAVVSRVEMTDDLRLARVWVRSFLHGDDPDKRKELLVGLERATPLLRRAVTKKVGLQFAPEFRFQYDDGQDNVTKVERLLAEIRDDDAKKSR
ncbi:MAG: 30S ribosome-binding factor RbfA [Polyangiaceae bacterium]